VKGARCKTSILQRLHREIALDTKNVLHYISVMKNITITLDEDVAKWAKVHAAKQEKSLSRLVGEILKKKMTEEEAYQTAMEHYLSQPPVKLKERESVYPKREDLYD
jgi:hypothetical protein